MSPHPASHPTGAQGSVASLLRAARALLGSRVPRADLSVTPDAIREVRRRRPHDIQGLLRTVFRPHRRRPYPAQELLALGPVPYLLLLQDRPDLTEVLTRYARDLAGLALHLSPGTPDLEAAITLLERGAALEEHLMLAGRIRRRLRVDDLSEARMYAAVTVVNALRVGELDPAISAREAVICLLHGTDHHPETLPLLGRLLLRHDERG